MERDERFISITRYVIISNMSHKTLTVGGVDGARVPSIGDFEGDFDELDVGIAVVGLELGALLGFDEGLDDGLAVGCVVKRVRFTFT